LPDFDRPSTDSLLFVIPHPLEFEIGPQTTRKLSSSSVSAVSRLAGLFRSFRRRRTASLSGHLDCTKNSRSSSITVGLSPIVRRDLRHAFQVNRTSAWHELRIRLAPDGSSCRDLPGNFVPEFLTLGEPRFSSGEAAASIAAFLPDFQDDFGRLTAAKPALACVMR